MIGLFFGSSTGTTSASANLIRESFAKHGIDVELMDIAEVFLEDMQEWDYLILGIPTWNTGQLQADWEAVLEEFDDLNLRGKRGAIFGLGDQRGYPDTFVDAMVFLAEQLEERGATLVGQWPVDGYSFRTSWAVRNGRFVGLVLDEVNQPELTADRIKAWVEQLMLEFAVAPRDTESRN